MPQKSFTRKSFEIVYKELAIPLTKFLVKRLGGDQEAVDEVFSRTIVAAWKGFNTFEHKSTYFTWICRIALNKIADYYRQEVNRKSGIITPLLKNIANIEEQRPSPEEQLVLEELCQSIRDCINLLPPDKVKLLYLRYWKELTNKEIANLMGVSERSVEGQLYRARVTLAKLMTE